MPHHAAVSHQESFSLPAAGRPVVFPLRPPAFHEAPRPPSDPLEGRRQGPLNSGSFSELGGNLQGKLCFAILLFLDVFESALAANRLGGLCDVNLDAQISWQAQYLVDLEVQISWQVQHFVNLEVQISWQAHLDVWIPWQVKYLVNPGCHSRSGAGHQ